LFVVKVPPFDHGSWSPGSTMWKKDASGKRRNTRLGFPFHSDTQAHSRNPSRDLLFENRFRNGRMKEKGILRDEGIVELVQHMVWVHER